MGRNAMVKMINMEMRNFNDVLCVTNILMKFCFNADYDESQLQQLFRK